MAISPLLEHIQTKLMTLSYSYILTMVNIVHMKKMGVNLYMKFLENAKSTDASSIMISRKRITENKQLQSTLKI